MQGEQELEIDPLGLSASNPGIAIHPSKFPSSDRLMVKPSDGKKRPLIQTRRKSIWKRILLMWEMEHRKIQMMRRSLESPAR